MGLSLVLRYHPPNPPSPHRYCRNEHTLYATNSVFNNENKNTTKFLSVNKVDVT